MNNQNPQNNQNDKEKAQKSVKIILIIFLIIFSMGFIGAFITIFSHATSDDPSMSFIPIIFGLFFVIAFVLSIIKVTKTVKTAISEIGNEENSGDGVNITANKEELTKQLNALEEGMTVAINDVTYTIVNNHMLLGTTGKVYDVNSLPLPKDGVYNLSYAKKQEIQNDPKFVPAIIPAMYYNSPDVILKDMVTNEINNRQFTGTIPKMEKKKNIISIIFAVIVLILMTLVFFHPINIVFNIFLIIITIIICLLVLKKMNINNVIIKEVKSRPDEDIKMVIASILDDKVQPKKFLRIVLFVVAIIIPCIIFFKPRMMYEKNDSGGYSLRYYTIGIINEDVVTIPETYNGLSVNEIRGETFKNVITVSEIKLPSKLTEIRGNTFQYSSIKKITIPDGVTRIGGHAFEGCRNLSEVIIPESVKEIGSSAFRDCDRLYTVTVSSDCDINSRAFKNSPTSIKRYGGSLNNYPEYNIEEDNKYNY